MKTPSSTAGSTANQKNYCRQYQKMVPPVVPGGIKSKLSANLYFFNSFRTLASAIESVLWNESAQMWFDFDLLNNKQRQFFYPSNLFPLWAECYDQTKKEQVRAKYINVPEVKYTSFFVGLPSLAEPTDR